METQDTTLDSQGFLHIRDGYIAHISTPTSTLRLRRTVRDELHHRAQRGAYKSYFMLPLKFKAEFKLTSAQADCFSRTTRCVP